MIQADRKFSEQVERAVAELEKATDAEVVVVAATRSGSYRDQALVIGSAVAFMVFLVLLALPWPVHPLFAAVDLFAAWAIGTWMADGHRLTATLAGARRRSEQVRQAAAAEFHLEAVHATPRRTGLLIYASGWEEQVEIIPDVGLEARIPRGLWSPATAAFHQTDLEGFLKGLTEVGKVLAEHVPATEQQRVDLENAPRIRS